MEIFTNKNDLSAMGFDEGCPQPEGEFPKHTPIAMAYVPFQKWERPYDDNIALSRGTIFPSLDKPFIGEEAVSNGRRTK